MSTALVLGAAAVLGASGLFGLLAGRRSTAGERLVTALAVLACVAGFVGALLALWDPAPVSLAWGLPWGRFDVAIDALSTAFLLPVFLLVGLGAVYGLGYWPQAHHPDLGRKLRLFYGLLGASMVVLVVARDSVLFLLAWEVMALSAFMLVTTEDHLEPVRRAGWVYLVATHLATLLLFALFALLRHTSGAFTLLPLAHMELGPMWAAFLLTVVGFGLKAGLMPFHVWLPGAHASAPSHVSAVMSGVMIKMGVYGIVRITSLLPSPPWAFGALLLTLGVISAVAGVAFALGQHDIKRLLAYHSIENIGIIVMGLGLALVGRSVGRPDLVALGLAGAVLHTWNHAIFKGMLFLGAGSAIHAVGTRTLDRMGGLAKPMPKTAALFVVGAAAISGLPPLNGFVSELLVYLGLFRSVGTGGALAGLALAAPALALVGALAVACFVKVVGVVFLGEPRTAEAARAIESPATMIGPMVVLAALCFAIGLMPSTVAPLLDRVVAAWAPGLGAPGVSAVAPLAWLTGAGVVLVAAASLVFVVLRRRQRAGTRSSTWGCGYVAPTARMQYTASSFAATLVGLFGGLLRPRTHAPDLATPFPGPARFESHVDDPVLEELIVPASRRIERFLARFRFIQQGRMQLYILWILLVLVALMLWALPIGGAVLGLFER